jgi:hypothetical protein
MPSTTSVCPLSTKNEAAIADGKTCMNMQKIRAMREKFLIKWFMVMAA